MEQTKNLTRADKQKVSQEQINKKSQKEQSSNFAVKETNKIENEFSEITTDCEDIQMLPHINQVTLSCSFCNKASSKKKIFV